MCYTSLAAAERCRRRRQLACGVISAGSLHCWTGHARREHRKRCHCVSLRTLLKSYISDSCERFASRMFILLLLPPGCALRLCFRVDVHGVQLSTDLLGSARWRRPAISTHVLHALPSSENELECAVFNNDGHPYFTTRAYGIK